MKVKTDKTFENKKSTFAMAKKKEKKNLSNSFKKILIQPNKSCLTLILSTSFKKILQKQKYKTNLMGLWASLICKAGVKTLENTSTTRP